MKGLLTPILSSVVFVAASLPRVVFAQNYNRDADNIYPNPPAHTEAARALVARLNELIIFPLISLMIGVALLVFLWGAFQFVYNASDEGARATGRRHMIWGIIGFVVMLSAFTILQIAAGTFGISVPR